MDGQGTKWHRNIAENFNRLSRAHERYRQTTDGQTDGRRQVNLSSRSLKTERTIFHFENSTLQMADKQTYLTQDLYAIRVFSTASDTTNFIHAAYNTKWNR